MTLALVVCAAVTGLVFCITATDRTRLLVAAFLAVPQGFVGPLGALSLPLSQCWVILVAACWLLERKGVSLRDPVLRSVFALTLVMAAAVSWSPEPLTGVLECARLVSFAFLYLYTVRVDRQHAAGLNGPLRVVLGWALVAAVLVWVFRLSPAAEAAYLHSPAAAFVAGQDAMRSFWGDGANNVMDPEKSGGFFINANVASMFLGVATFAFLVLRAEEGRRRYAAAAVVTWSATFATGSKTAAALALLLPVAVRAVHVLGTPAGRAFLPQAAAAVGLGAWLAPRLLEQYVPGYADASAESLESRAPLWDAAERMFLDHVLLGLGHGGWASMMEQYAALGVTALPPHNLIIAAWAASGLFGALGVLAVLTTVLVRLVVVVVRTAGSQESRTAGYALGAWLWALIHGMGDNTAVYGESKSMIVLAMLIGVVSARRSVPGAASTQPGVPPPTTPATVPPGGAACPA